jgi:hypothetical protein
LVTPDAGGSKVEFDPQGRDEHNNIVFLCVLVHFPANTAKSLKKRPNCALAIFRNLYDHRISSFIQPQEGVLSV